MMLKSSISFTLINLVIFRNDSWFRTSLFHCPWCERGLIISYIYMCMIRTVLLLAMQMVCFKFPWNTSETNASCQEFILLVLRLDVSLYCIIKVCLLPIELCWNVDGKSQCLYSQCISLCQCIKTHTSVSH